VFVSCDEVVGRIERGKSQSGEMGTQGKKKGREKGGSGKSVEKAKGIENMKEKHRQI
jgi:hypothetical protein